MFGAYYSDPNAQVNPNARVYSPEKIGEVPKSKEKKGELSPERQADRTSGNVGQFFRAASAL